VKVLHFYKTYYPETVGGIEKVINEIAQGAVRHGVETTIMTLSPSDREETVQVDGHLVYRCKINFELSSTPFSLKAFSLFHRLSKDADIIHYHFPYPFADLIHLITRVKKPSVVTYHSDIIKQKNMIKLYRPLKRWFLKNVDKIVATSPNYLKSSDILEKYKEKVSVIPIGIDKFSYPEPDETTFEYYKNLFGDKFFMFTGVLRYYKGLHILIEAAHYVDDVPIVLMGAGPIEEELKEHAQRLGVKNVYFLGYLPEEDKVALLNLCYAKVFPSHLRSEAFGISLLEGAMYGKPMISSEIGTGTTHINIDGETGIVIPPSDSATLGEAMRKLLDNPELAAEYGRNAENRYEKLFTAERMSREYFELYKSILK